MRIILFLGIDLVLALEDMPADGTDMSEGALALYLLYRVVMPWKPYLVVTDVSRVRALSTGTWFGDREAEKNDKAASAARKMKEADESGQRREDDGEVGETTRDGDMGRKRSTVGGSIKGILKSNGGSFRK
ncbi:hypothetical protein HKX48_004869 [Thoreauomyces humboldtii]|nr:hypothetical protein HKX48_004869 [Thoreauomyces humboldtii]